MTRTQIPADVACPTWCHKGHGHPYEPDGPDGDLRRLHSGSLGRSTALGIEINIIATEGRAPDGTVTVVAPEIYPEFLWDGPYTPAQLRMFAAVLLNAADAGDVAFTET